MGENGNEVHSEEVTDTREQARAHAAEILVRRMDELLDRYPIDYKAIDREAAEAAKDSEREQGDLVET